MSKIVTRDANNVSLVACLVLLNEEEDSMKPPVVSGCGYVAKVIQPEMDQSAVISASVFNLTVLHAFFNFNRDAISVFFRVQTPGTNAIKLFFPALDVSAQ